jgi:hypothetical protein
MPRHALPDVPQGPPEPPLSETTRSQVLAAPAAQAGHPAADACAPARRPRPAQLRRQLAAGRSSGKHDLLNALLAAADDEGRLMRDEEERDILGAGEWAVGGCWGGGGGGGGVVCAGCLVHKCRQGRGQARARPAAEA